MNYYRRRGGSGAGYSIREKEEVVVALVSVMKEVEKGDYSICLTSRDYINELPGLKVSGRIIKEEKRKEYEEDDFKMSF